jgi:hypothetical protein
MELRGSGGKVVDLENGVDWGRENSSEGAARNLIILELLQFYFPRIDGHVGRVSCLQLSAYSDMKRLE